MAERELTLKIVVDDSQATEKTEKFSAALNNLQTTAAETGAQITVLETQVKNLGATNQVVAEKTALLNNSLKSFETVKGSTFENIRGGINNIGEAAGLTYKNLGAMGSAGAVMGAGYAGWGVGRMIADFFDLDKKIGDATAKLFGFGDVAAQTAAAKADVLAKATENVGHKVTDYTEAIEINARAAKQMQIAMNELNDSVKNWQAQIDRVKTEGRLDQLNTDIKMQVLNVKDLEVKYTLTAHAVEYYKHQLEDAEKASRAHLKAAEDARKASEKAAQQQAKEMERLSEQYQESANAAHKVEMEFYGIGSAAQSIGKTSQSVLSDQNKDLMANYEAAKKVESGVYGIGTAIRDVGKASVEAKPKVGGFLGVLNDLGLKAGDLNRIFQAAFTGGGGVSGAVESMATKVTGKLLSMIPIVGPIMSEFAGAIVAGVKSLWDDVKSIFGGPDRDERAARAEFAKLFSDTNQALDVLGKKFAEAGIDGETARQYIQKLFDATHVSAQAVQDAMDAINKRLSQGANTAADSIDATTESVDKLKRALLDVPNLPSDSGGDSSYGSTGGVVTADGIQHFARGGVVLPFRSRGTDTVPAMLTPGEMVLTKRQQAQMGGSGQIPALNVYLDGQQLEVVVTRRQDENYRLRRKTSAR